MNEIHVAGPEREQLASARPGEYCRREEVAPAGRDLGDDLGDHLRFQEADLSLWDLPLRHLGNGILAAEQAGAEREGEHGAQG